MTIKFWSKGEEKYRFLSNFYPCEIKALCPSEDGARIETWFHFPSVEHAYQAAKDKSLSYVAQFMVDDEGKSISAAEAKRLSRNANLRPDWETAKDAIMEMWVRKKFQNPILALRLAETGDEELIHYAPWDAYWGDGRDGRGQNKLGQILMKVRTEIQKKLNKAAVTRGDEPRFENKEKTMKIICGTGHRPNKLGPKPYCYGQEMKSKLIRLARFALEKVKPDLVITGGALGWDQALAMACHEAGIPFDIYIPFEGFDATWPDESQVYLARLMKLAREVKICSGPGYSPEKMQIRNEMMVNPSEYVLALWDGSSGGTKNCLDYAAKLKRPVGNCWNRWVSGDF